MKGKIILIVVLLCSWCLGEGEKIYWTDKTNKIYCCNLDGSNIVPIISNGLMGVKNIEIDSRRGRIYFTDILMKKVMSTDMDGQNVRDVIRGKGKISSIALDISGEITIVYASQQDLEGNNIYKVDTSTNVIETIIPDFSISSLAVYPNNISNKMLLMGRFSDIYIYYIDQPERDIELAIDYLSSIGDLFVYGHDLFLVNEDNVAWMNADCSGFINYAFTMPSYGKLVVFENKVYYTYQPHEGLYRANFDGSEPELLVDGYRPWYIDIYNPNELECSNPPKADLNDDCMVNLEDWYLFASEWLECGLVPVEACH